MGMKFFRVYYSPLVRYDFETLKQAMAFLKKGVIPAGARIEKISSSTDNFTGAIHWKIKTLRKY